MWLEIIANKVRNNSLSLMQGPNCKAKRFGFHVLTNGEPLAFQRKLSLIIINENMYSVTIFLRGFLESPQNYSVSFHQMSVKMARNRNPRSLINDTKIAFAMRAGKEWT